MTRRRNVTRLSNRAGRLENGPRATWRSALGLVLACGGPPLLAALPRLTGHAIPFPSGLVAYAALVAAVITIGVFWEGLSLHHLGVRRPGAWTMVTAVLVALACFLFVAPTMSWLLRSAHTTEFADGRAALATLTVWQRCVVVVVGVAFEELLYRGYAFERLLSWTRSPSVAITSSAAVFALAHAPLWGLHVALVLVLPGVLFNVVYYHRRDLPALVAAHTAVDLVGVALA